MRITRFLAFGTIFCVLMLSDGIAPQPAQKSVFAQEVLAAPQLAGPPDGIRQQNLGPFTLFWRNPQGATRFQIMVTPFNNDGPELNLIISDPVKVASQSYVIEPPKIGVKMQWMLPGMSYTWKIRVSDATSPVGEDDQSWSPWSESWRFITPPPPSCCWSDPMSPHNDAILSGSGSVTLVWSSVGDTIFYYEVQVSTDEKFRTGKDAIAAVWHMLIHGGLTQPLNSWTTPTLEPGKVYYWRVRPRVQGDGAPVGWGPIYRFITPPVPAIAFWSSRDNYDYGEIYLMNPDGTNVVRRTIDGSRSPSRSTANSPDWAPDGLRIVATYDGRFSESGDGLGIINADGSVSSLVNKRGSENAASWSSNGTSIAFHRSSNIFIINPDGSGETQLTNNPSDIIDRLPDWSPDGTKIAFERHYCPRSCTHSDIFVIRADGSEPMNLTNTMPDAPYVSSPTWSPDGSKIAFILGRASFDLYVMNSDGTNPKRLTFGERVFNPWAKIGDGGRVAWSPDGTKIAYSAGWEGNNEIYVMNSDGSGPHVNITHNPASDTSPTWAQR